MWSADALLVTEHFQHDIKYFHLKRINMSSEAVMNATNKKIYR